MRLPVTTTKDASNKTAPRSFVWALLSATLLFVGLAPAQAAADLSFSYSAGALTGPATFTGLGYHSLGLINGDGAPATFTVAHLHDGTAVADYESVNNSLLAAIASRGDESQYIPDLMKSVDALGGTIVVPGGEADIFVDLQAGTYVVAAAPEGENGISGTTSYLAFTVDAGGQAAAAAPSTSYAVDFADFSFNFPATVPAGTNLWKVSNVGSQVHLSTIYKLLPGKTMDDLKSFLSGSGDAGGPPPFDTTSILDVEAVSPGQTVYIPLDLTAGDWVAVCFIQDLTPPHLPHFMEGMIQEFTVS